MPSRNDIVTACMNPQQVYLPVPDLNKKKAILKLNTDQNKIASDPLATKERLAVDYFPENMSCFFCKNKQTNKIPLHFFKCMSSFLFCLSAYVQCLPEGRRGRRIPWNWSHRIQQPAWAQCWELSTYPS